MLSGPHRQFCEGVVSGLTFSDAYRAAYPEAAPENARKNAARLTAREDIQAEIARLRAVADERAGSAVLTLMEKRIFLARIVRACVALLPEDSDLWQSIKRTEDATEFRLPDKLAAIRLDNDLAGEGATAGAEDAITQMIERCMK